MQSSTVPDTSRWPWMGSLMTEEVWDVSGALGTEGEGRGGGWVAYLLHGASAGLERRRAVTK